MSKALLAAVFATASVACVPAALAQGRELTREHDGSLGAFAAVGGEYTSLVIADCFACTGSTVDADGTVHRARTIDGPDMVLDVGGSMAVGQAGGEFLLRGRLVFLSTARGFSLMVGYRKYWGKDDIKTFVAADVLATLEPLVTFGLRPGFGVMWDFSPIMGLYAEANGSFTLGWGRRFGAELTIGFQARSYLLE